MKVANAVFAAMLPGLAAAASFVTGNRVSEDTFVYKIETCTDAKPCSLYLVRLSDGERVATIFENKAGSEFTAKIRNVPTGTYVFQATGGEDGKTRATTQFTFHNNLVTTGTEPTTSSPSTLSVTSTSPATTATSSEHGSTGMSTEASTGTATGTASGTKTGTQTGSSTGTSTGASTVTTTGSLTTNDAVTTTKTSKTGTGTTSTPLTKGPSTTTTSKVPSATTTSGNSGNRVIFSPWALAVAMALQWLLF